MVDNTRINKNSTTGDLVATDDVGGVKHQRVKMEYGADGTAQEVSSLHPMPVTPTGANVDAFTRFRISQPVGIFNNKNVSGSNSDNWQEETNGTGAITYLKNESSVQLGVGTASGEYAIRQSTRYIPYIPGKSQLIIMTGLLGVGKANVIRRIGLFDDRDGLFFELDGTSLGTVIRSYTDGTTAIDTVTQQADWNIDSLDGSGISGITLDASKTQIFMIDFQWLGVGKIRYGFNIDGAVVYCHSESASNTADKVFMSTPTLPFRYEIRNTGIAASASTMKEICASAASEGGYNFIGFEFSASHVVTPRTAISERTPVLAIRLKDSYVNKPNRRTAKLSKINVYVANAVTCLELSHLNAPSDATATWNDVSIDSAVEYSTDIAAVTGNDEHVVHSWYQIAGSGMGQALPPSSVTISGILGQHNFISQNKNSDNSQMLVLFATPLSGTCDIAAAIEWIEFD